MLRTVLSAIIVLSVAAFLIACDEPNSTVTGSKTTMTDSELENSIRAKLSSDSQLKAANLTVSANAARNEATVSGTVDSQALRTKAVELARSTNDGLKVTDKVDVKPHELTRAEYTADQARSERTKAKDLKETIGDSLDDAWIHAKIVAKLIGDSNTPERKINVDVVNNVVTLRGTVDTGTQKLDAERIARSTDGVKNVNNQIKVVAKAKA
ncbi:MAG TPA: BON domain-containing protein [Blastocatellia bacterium]|nr:BON domain-containing protein [Blastocatellia bacterium]